MTGRRALSGPRPGDRSVRSARTVPRARPRRPAGPGATAAAIARTVDLMRAGSGLGGGSRPPASVPALPARGSRDVTAVRRGSPTLRARADPRGAAPVTVISVPRVIVLAARGRSVRVPVRAAPGVPVRPAARANGTSVRTVAPANAPGLRVETRGRPAPATTVRSVPPAPGPGRTGQARAGDRVSRAAARTARSRVTVGRSGRADRAPAPRAGATAATSDRATSRLVDRSAGRGSVRHTEPVPVSERIAARTDRTASDPRRRVPVGTVIVGRAVHRGSGRPAHARTAPPLVPVRRAAGASRRATPPTARTTVPRGLQATGRVRRVHARATGHGPTTVRGSRTAGAQASVGGPVSAGSDLRASARTRRARRVRRAASAGSGPRASVRTRRARSVRRTVSGRRAVSGPRTGRVPSGAGGSRTGPGVPIAGVRGRTGRRARRPTGRPGRPACGPTASVVTVRGVLAGSGPVPHARGVAGTSRRAGSGTTTVGRPVRRSRTAYPRPSCRRTSPSRTSTGPCARGCAR